MATVWKDKKNVEMLSTMCDPKKTASVERRQKDGSKITVSCPDAVVQYNKYTWVGSTREISCDTTTESG